MYKGWNEGYNVSEAEAVKIWRPQALVNLLGS